MAQHSPFPLNRKPLDKRAVIITRQRERAFEMAAILERAGVRIIYCPTIEIIPPNSWSELDDAIRRIRTYDWIIFTSANGVKFLSRRLDELGIGVSILNSLVSCAIGPATATALSSIGARVDLTAADSRAEGALEAIINHVGGPDSVRGLRFLVPRAQVAREFLPAELRKLGATVDAVDAYRTIKPDLDSQAITRLLEEGQVGAITFTSPSTVDHFADLIGGADLPALLRGVLIGCIGPVTAAAARRRGLELIVQPDSHNGEALAQMIVDKLTQPGRSYDRTADES